MKKILLQTAGLISLALGALGAFLPLLPSTCFILLSTWLFSKSSPRFHQWMVHRSPFAQTINQWQQHRVIPKKVKAMATISILASFALSAWLVSNPMVIALLAAGMLLLLMYLLTRNSEVSAEQHHALMHVRTHE